MSKCARNGGSHVYVAGCTVTACVKVGVTGNIGDLGRYVDEFAFRLNEGNVARHTLERLGSFIDGVAGKRLTYKALIA